MFILLNNVFVVDAMFLVYKQFMAMQSSHFGENIIFNAILNCVVVANGSVATHDVNGVRAWVNYIGFTSKRVFVVTFEARENCMVHVLRTKSFLDVDDNLWNQLFDS
jgi:hypothetical protein